MTKKALGIYPKADRGWSSHLTDIFKKSGFAVGNCGIATISLVSSPKATTTQKNNQVQVDRLRYQLHTDALVRGTTNVANLITVGDDLDVVWIGHGGYMSSDNNNSTKFAPHYGTDGPQAYMSAKELARIIYTICVTNTATHVYPKSLTILSCYSGNARATQWREPATKEGNAVTAIMKISNSTDPLAFRVLVHLYSMFDPAPAYKCTVAAPTRDLTGMEIRGLAIPPTGGDWVFGEL